MGGAVNRSGNEKIPGPNITEIRTITKEEMDYAKADIVKRSESTYTLCETIRTIYDIANGIENNAIKEDIQDKCVMILAFAKRMDRKLSKYRLNTISAGDDKI